MVVEAEPAYVDHGDLVVGRRARLRLADAARGDHQVRHLRLRAAVPEVGGVEPDAAVAQGGREHERVGARLGQDRLAAGGHRVDADPAVDGTASHKSSVSPGMPDPQAHVSVECVYWTDVRPPTQARGGTSGRKSRRSLPAAASSRRPGRRRSRASGSPHTSQTPGSRSPASVRTLQRTCPQLSQRTSSPIWVASTPMVQTENRRSFHSFRLSRRWTSGSTGGWRS